MGQIFVLLLLVAGYRCEFKSRIRDTLTDHEIEGYMKIRLFYDVAEAQIVNEVAVVGTAHSNERLAAIMHSAKTCGPAKTWREERKEAADRFLMVYNNDPGILNRLVAVDETTILNCRLVMIAGSMKFKFVHAEYVRNSKAREQDILLFLAGLEKKLAPVKPVIYWDNINIHTAPEVLSFITAKGWEVWRQPRGSSDTNPLDYLDFKVLRKEIGRLVQTFTVEEVLPYLTETINRINARGDLQGVVKLPGVWESLSRTDGLSAYDGNKCEA